jgi:hypothetical protein
MGFFIDGLRQGGPFMWPLLLSVPVCLALFIVRIQKAQKQELPGLGLALVSGLVAFGLFGAAAGEVQIWDAVAHASAEHKEDMIKMGMTISIIPLQFSLIFAVFVAIGFGTVWTTVRHLDLPSPKGQTAARWLGYASALLLCSGLAMYLYMRTLSMGMNGATATEAAAVVPTIATLISSTSIVAFFAWLLSGIAALVSLASVFRGPQVPTET